MSVSLLWHRRMEKTALLMQIPSFMTHCSEDGFKSSLNWSSWSYSGSSTATGKCETRSIRLIISYNDLSVVKVDLVPFTPPTCRWRRYNSTATTTAGTEREVSSQFEPVFQTGRPSSRREAEIFP